MKIESKYDIGQKLWEIRLRNTAETETCPHCNQKIYHSEWYLDDCEQEIHGVSSKDGIIYYKVYRPCIYREYVYESDIGHIYFPTREEAMEAARLRNENGD